MVYLGLYLLMFISGFYDFFKKNRNVTIFLFLTTFLVLFLAAGFRYQTGWDWPNYTDFFDEVPSRWKKLLDFLNSPYNNYEKGYTLLNALIKALGGNVQWIFALFSFFSIGLVYYALPKYTPYVFVTLFIYLFHGYYLNFSYIRQGLAIAIFFYALRFLLEKSFIKYLACIVFASFFHISSLAFIPLYFFLNRNIPIYIYVSILVIAFILYKIGWLNFMLAGILNGNPLMIKFVELVRKLSDRGAAGLSSRFFEYMLLFLFCLTLKKRLIPSLPYCLIFINLAFVYLTVYILFNDLQILVERIGVLFIMGPIMLYSYILVPLKEGIFKVSIYVAMALVLFLRGYNFFFAPTDAPVSNAQQFFPYRNYLIEMID